MAETHFENHLRSLIKKLDLGAISDLLADDSPGNYILYSSTSRTFYIQWQYYGYISY